LARPDGKKFFPRRVFLNEGKVIRAVRQTKWLSKKGGKVRFEKGVKTLKKGKEQ
jgi:hypothetical protein